MRRAAKAGVNERHDADRARVASRPRGAAPGPPAIPARRLEEPDLAWLRRTFSDGLLRTGALYGVRP